MYGEETLRVPTVQERNDAPFAELFRTEYSTVYRYFYYRTGSRTMSGISHRRHLSGPIARLTDSIRPARRLQHGFSPSGGAYTWTNGGGPDGTYMRRKRYRNP